MMLCDVMCLVSWLMRLRRRLHVLLVPKRIAVGPGPVGLTTRESYSARRLGGSGKTRAGSFLRVL